MVLEERIKSFSALGEILRDSLDGKPTLFSSQLNSLIETLHLTNHWFTPENVKLAVRSIAEELTFFNLTKLCSFYPALQDKYKPLRIGLVMAGNIPLAGFHDLFSVLITGNEAVVKTSSKDAGLIHFITDTLSAINPSFTGKISFAEGILTEFDAIIATGSDNSSRYFGHYFGRYPGIIRKNRNSIAVIDGNESDAELTALGKDVFSYFGLGCRSVSKIIIPAGYDLTTITGNWESYSGIVGHTKYANNYDFNKAVFIVNKEKFTDTGYLLMMESSGLASPVAVLYYEFYDSAEQVNQLREKLNEKIQCVIGRKDIPFGKAQSPALWDYADGIDTIDFILKKNNPGLL